MNNASERSSSPPALPFAEKHREAGGHDLSLSEHLTQYGFQQMAV